MSQKYSLAFFKLKKSLERDVRTFWSLCISQEFAQSSLKEFDQSKRITEVTSNKPPFSFVDLKCDEIRKALLLAMNFSRENALVNLVTDFEVYLFETHVRVVSMKPSVLQDSTMQFQAKEIVSGIGEADFRKWFAVNVTDKLVRNKQHKEIIERISKFCRYALISISNEIDEWEKWTYVRNAIVHVARKVSSDLNRVWPERFATIGHDLAIDDEDLMKVQALAFKLAETIDTMVVDRMIREADAILVIREMFVRFGISDPGQIGRILQKNFAYKMRRQTVEQAIARQRRSNEPINAYDFDSIVGEIDLMA